MTTLPLFVRVTFSGTVSLPPSGIVRVLPSGMTAPSGTVASPTTAPSPPRKTTLSLMIIGSSLLLRSAQESTIDTSPVPAALLFMKLSTPSGVLTVSTLPVTLTPLDALVAFKYSMPAVPPDTETFAPPLISTFWPVLMPLAFSETAVTSAPVAVTLHVA